MSRPYTHIVRVGETPTSIAAAYTGSNAPGALRALLRANPTKPRSGGTFASIHEGEALALPDFWFQVSEGTKGRGLGGIGVGDAPQSNGLPSSTDIINSGVQSGTNWLISELHIPIGQGGVDIVSAIVSLPVDAYAGFIAGTVAAEAVNILAGSALAVLAIFAPEVAASIAVIVGTALDFVPVMGEVVAVAEALVVIAEAIESPPSITTEGPGGPVTVDVSTYVTENVHAAAYDAPYYAMMSPSDYAVMKTVSVDDLWMMGGLVPVFVPSGTPATSEVVTMAAPGAQSILHAVQLSTAAATAPLVANILPLFLGTIQSTLPLLTDAEVAQIGTTVQPIHDAIVANAQAWANGLNPPPTSDEINTKYGLLPTDRDAILANWRPPVGSGLKISPKKPSAKTASTSSGVATGVAAVGIATAAATWGLAAYRGVSMATELKGWWDRASSLVKKVK